MGRSRHGTGTTLFVGNIDGSGVDHVVIKAPRFGISEDEVISITGELQKEVEVSPLSIFSSTQQQLQQAQLLAKIDHQSIIPLLGTGRMPMRNGGQFYFFAVRWLGGA